MTENRAKTWTPARIVILVLLGVTLLAGTFLLAMRVMVNLQMQNAMKWSADTEITQLDKIRYAKMVMIPDLTEYIDSCSIRGIRDPEYCIQTMSFDTVEELYSILPFDSEEDYQTALDSIGDPLATGPDIPEGADNCTAYIAEGLPVTEDDGDGKVLAYYYSHENYIIRDADGYRFAFFVQTT